MTKTNIYMAKYQRYYCMTMDHDPLSSKSESGNRNFPGLFAGSMILILILFYYTSFAQETTELSKAGIHIIPYPQEVKLRGKDVTLEKNVTIVLDKTATENDKFAAAQVTKYLSETLNIQTSLQNASAGKSIILTRKNGNKKSGEEGYTLTTETDRIILRAKTEAGLFYGIQTLLQLIQKNATGAYIKGMEIVDWPVTPVRAIHYDNLYHQDTRAYVEDFIRDLARYKINMLVWEWGDKFDYPGHPEIGVPGAFTMKEVQEITRYARKYHIRIVPLVQGLGHVQFILKWPQLAHLREIPASNWEFCPLKEGTYDLLFDLWDAAIKATPGSGYIHIGSDETYELGLCANCTKKAEEIGKTGLYHLFTAKSAKHLQAKGRKVMVWETPMGWTKNVTANKNFTVPQKGTILTESYNYETPDLKYAKEAKVMGYPVYAYDPNPGIEHLFLPYFFKENGDGSKRTGSLEDSYNFLTSHLGKGVYDGMIRTSWDASGVHYQVWMLQFALAAAYSWNAAKPGLSEFTGTFFKNYYGNNETDLEKLFRLFNEGAYYYMGTFERKVWHWGEIGKTHIPDLPRTDALEYDPFWNTEYAGQVKKANEFLEKMNQAIDICKINLSKNLDHSHDIEVFLSIAELIRHTALTYIDLSNLEKAITEAHKQRFISYEETYRNLEKAEKIIKGQLARRKKVFDDLVTTWEKTRLPKGMSTHDKKYFYRQDRGRYYGNRAPDMTYLIIDEQDLDLEGYLVKLGEYKNFFRDRYLPETSEKSGSK
jgi:hypothetical protein